MVKILTWNVNGIRALKIPLKQQLDNLDADIICLQETKVTRDQLDEQTAIVDGYNSYFSFSKVKSGYSGVATFVRETATPCRAEEGLSGVCWPSTAPDSQRIGCYNHEEDFTSDELVKLDNEGRCVITEHKIINGVGEESLLVVINVYCPRAEPGNRDRLEYKLRFYHLLQLRAEAILSSGSHVIVLGDINTSHKKIDHCNPDEDEEFYANPGRHWMDGFLRPVDSTDLSVTTTQRFVDTYRWLHPNELNAFTNWCTLTGARATNYGCRLDYIMSDAGLLPCLSACRILADVEGSDHCPVVAEFDRRVVTALKCPSLCTKFLPQFAGRQQKLVSFFTKRSSATFSQNLAESQSEKLSVTDSQPSQTSSADLENRTSSLDRDSGGIICCDSSRNSSLEVSSESQQEEEFNFQLFERCSEAVLHDVSTETPGAKRTSASISAKQTKTKKAKCSDASKTDSKQSNLLNFFNKPRDSKASVQTTELKSTAVTVLRSDTKTKLEVQKLNEAPVLSKPNSSGLTENKTAIMPTLPNSTDVVKQPEVSAWKNLLKGPPQTPMCKGHNEPCVLRTVRKDGPNKGKQFWVCNRPEGHKGNPEARCDHFVWITQKK